MLQDLQSAGKQDVRFLIVNGQDQASMASAPALRERVSLPILQESPLEPIWTRLQGGSGDVFVYDRCGRLAYYVPFPLSHSANGDMSAVRYAVSEAYEHSPCGEQCLEEPPSPTTVPSTDSLHYGRAVGSGQTEVASPEVQGSPSDNRILVREDSTETTAQPRTRDSLGWRIVHMFFGRQSTGRNGTSEGTTVGADGNLEVVDAGNHPDLPSECRDVYKSTCYDWPKEVIQRVDRCCNGSLPREGQSTRPCNPCGTLTRRRCKKLRPLISCCKAMFLTRDRLLAQEYVGLFRDFDKDAYEDLFAVSCSRGRSV